jgi:N-acetylneuraminate synthase
MNCLSEYPPDYDDMALRFIPKMIERYPLSLIGHSDHSPDLFTSFAAVTLGARIIEKHVILDKRQPGPDQSVSIDFFDLAKLVEGVRKIEAACKHEDKSVREKEKQIRQWAFRSLVATKNIRAGEQISDDMIWSKRPGTGIPSWKMDDIIGKTAKRDIERNTLLRIQDFE